ncbi:hypothetical protein K501DRAFT_239453 [Backusella circina FSU 941]|nr:hypothetical protein K501DRAFT_239453 [Backusella circina FSU 941]
MAPLQIISPGLGRTGTDSLRTALEILGYKTMHHKNFVYDSTLDPDLFLKAHCNREDADWDKVYEKYDAAVDLPTWLWYKDLMKKYPDAKIILTMRDPDSWYKSVSKIAKDFKETGESANATERLQRIMEFTNVVLNDYPLTNRANIGDEELTKKGYIKHNEDVIEHVPPERLLMMELGEGWERLCAFLGKEVPSVPYPNVNNLNEFSDYLNDIKNNELLTRKI